MSEDIVRLVEDIGFALNESGDVHKELREYVDVASDLYERFKANTDNTELSADEMPYGEALARVGHECALERIEDVRSRLELLLDKAIAADTGQGPMFTAQEIPALRNTVETATGTIKEIRTLMDNLLGLPPPEYRPVHS